MDIAYSTIELSSRLREKYRDYLRPELISVILFQSPSEIWLETVANETTTGGWEKITTRRTSLDFIVLDPDCDQPMFNPADPIEVNASKFVEELDAYSICNTTDLFTDRACQRISRKLNTFGIEP